jgi:hypothetical protein
MAPAHRHTSGRSLVLSILCLQAICLQVTSECDQTFVSRPGGPLNGTFQAPEFVNLRGHSRQCIYTFLAGLGQRVEIVFTSFALRGAPPEYVAFKSTFKSFNRFIMWSIRKLASDWVVRCSTLIPSFSLLTLCVLSHFSTESHALYMCSIFGRWLVVVETVWNENRASR